MKKSILFLIAITTVIQLSGQKDRVYTDLIGALKSPAEVYILNVENKGMSSISYIERLINLEKLNLAGNRLIILPKELGLLKNLKECDLSGNSGITSLPLEFYNLNKLKTLTSLKN